MATVKNDQAKGIKPMPIGFGADLIQALLAIELTANPAVNDILVLGYIPEDHKVEDWFIESDDLDTNGTPTIAFSLGVLNADLTDIDTTARGGGAAWGTALDVAQSGALVRATTAAATKTPSSSNDRKFIGLKVTAVAATFQAGAIRLHLSYRPSDNGK